MFSRLVPKLYLNSIYELNLDGLRRRGIRGLITDLDNTLVAWGSAEVPDSLVRWISGARAAGFRICLVSNNTLPRVGSFARALEIPAIAKARKPFNRAYKEAMSLMGTTPPETAVIGDQVFTDVFGGNLLGLFTVLVAPIDSREFVGTRLVRFVERRLLCCLEKKGLLDRQSLGRDRPQQEWP